MRVVYVVPGVMPQAEMDRRCGLLREWAFPGTEVDIVGVTEGPGSIESAYEEYLSIAPTAKLMVELEQKGYDAAILGCAGDPGLDAMRELTGKMLVVAPGATSFLAAAMLGHRFAVLTVDDTMIQLSYELAFKAGCSEKLAAVAGVNIPVLDLANDREATIGKMLTLCRTLIQEKQVDTLVLGCMSMGFLNVAEDISKAVGVPCVNPAKVCLKFAEALVGCGHTHSKAAYALPPKIRAGKTLDQLYIRS